MAHLTMAFAKIGGDLLAVQELDTGPRVRLWSDEGAICEMQEAEFKDMIDDGLIEAPQLTPTTLRKLRKLSDEITPNMRPPDAVKKARKILSRDAPQ